MNNIFDSFIKEFTRFLLPGLNFYVLVIVLPSLLLSGPKTVDTWKLLSPWQILVFSSVGGYILDSLGSYRWHFLNGKYDKKYKKLTKTLRQESHAKEDEGEDPDYFLASAWINAQELYSRLFAERAAWIAILETSFSLLISGSVFIISGILFGIYANVDPNDVASSSNISKQITYIVRYPLIGIMLGIILLLLSWRTATKGIQRMDAHDRKLVELVKKYPLYPSSDDDTNSN